MDGTEAQKLDLLPRVATGELIMSFALTEADAGSDAAAVTTRGVRQGDDYVLNGTKRFITNAPRADVFTLMARTDGAGRWRHLRLHRARRPARPDARARPTRRWASAARSTCDVILDDARVPAEASSAARGRGFKTAMKVLDRGRLHIAAVPWGWRSASCDESVATRASADQFGKRDRRATSSYRPCSPTAQAELFAGRAHGAGRACATTPSDGRRDRPGAAPVGCKLFCSEMVGRVADRAVQILGGSGYMRECPVERFYRDVRPPGSTRAPPRSSNSSSPAS